MHIISIGNEPYGSAPAHRRADLFRVLYMQGLKIMRLTELGEDREKLEGPLSAMFAADHFKAGVPKTTGTWPVSPSLYRTRIRRSSV